jgi:ketosteroid isomerase-like protein
MQAGESARYRGRLFYVVRVTPDGWAVIRDDESEEMRVRVTSLRPA